MELTHSEIRQRILAITGMSYDQYKQLVFETGMQFAELQTNNDAWAATAMTSTRAYWAWWRNQWAIADRGLIEEWIARPWASDDAFWTERYEQIHQLSQMVATPNKQVMDETYSAMTTRVWREHRQTPSPIGEGRGEDKDLLTKK